MDFPISEDGPVDDFTTEKIVELIDYRDVEKDVENVTIVKDTVRPKKSELLVDGSRRRSDVEVAIEETDSPMFERMTNAPKTVSSVDKVNEDDESLLSVTQKVSISSIFIF